MRSMMYFQAVPAYIGFVVNDVLPLFSHVIYRFNGLRARVLCMRCSSIDIG